MKLKKERMYVVEWGLMKKKELVLANAASSATKHKFYKW